MSIKQPCEVSGGTDDEEEDGVEGVAKSYQQSQASKTCPRHIYTYTYTRTQASGVSF